MSWHFLHLGKLVDEDGRTRHRAEHRFVARSVGFPIAAANIIGRRDPVRPLVKIDWNLGGVRRRAAFVQIPLRLAGHDHTLRVIEHDATEDLAAGGRGYVKRTYLLQRADLWQPQDAALPVQLIKEPPAFQDVIEVPLWHPKPHVPGARYDDDELRRLQAGSLTVQGMMNDGRVRRINNLLARVEPKIAARLSIDLSQESERAVLRWIE